MINRENAGIRLSVIALLVALFGYLFPFEPVRESPVEPIIRILQSAIYILEPDDSQQPGKPAATPILEPPGVSAIAVAPTDIPTIVQAVPTLERSNVSASAGSMMLLLAL